MCTGTCHSMVSLKVPGDYNYLALRGLTLKFTCKTSPPKPIKSAAYESTKDSNSHIYFNSFPLRKCTDLSKTHRKESTRQSLPPQNCPGFASERLTNGFNVWDWHGSWQIPLVWYSVGQQTEKQYSGAMPKQTARL